MLPGDHRDRLDYDPNVMTGCTARDQKIINKALARGRTLKVDITEDGLRVVDRGCLIAAAQYINYDPATMRGKTEWDEAAIKNALAAGRKLHVVLAEDELRVIDLIVFIAVAVYKDI